MFFSPTQVFKSTSTAIFLLSLIFAGCGKNHKSSSAGAGPSGTSPSGVSILDSSSDPEVRRLGEQGRIYRRALQNQLETTGELQDLSTAQTTTLSQCAGLRNNSDLQTLAQSNAALATESAALEADVENAIHEYDALERQTRVDPALNLNNSSEDLSARREQALLVEIASKEQTLRDLNNQLARGSNSTASIDSPAADSINAQANQFNITSQIYAVTNQLTDTRNQLSSLRANRQNNHRQIEFIINHYRSQSSSFQAVLASFDQRSSALRQSATEQAQRASAICPAAP